MPIEWGPVLAGGLSGGLGLAGSMMSASMSKAAAKRMIRFQDLMSRTQYQRMTEDMRKAGLNPILGIASGGNTAMPGAMPTVPDMGGAAGTGVSAALQARMNKQNIAASKAQVKNIDVQTKQGKQELFWQKRIRQYYKDNPWAQQAIQGAMAANKAGVNPVFGAALGIFSNAKDKKKYERPEGPVTNESIDKILDRYKDHFGGQRID